MKKLCFLLSLLLFIACSKSNECTEINDGEEFVLEPGDRICLPEGEELVINSMENQLCPCEAICVSPGQILISYEITLENGQSFESQTAYIPDQSFQLADIGVSLDYTFEPLGIEFTEDCILANPNPDIKSIDLRLTTN